MNDMSDTWDAQWSTLLTRCYGETVEAKPGFKANLLNQLKEKAAENRGEDAVLDMNQDTNWSRLMKAAYVPCHYEEDFKAGLLGKLKARQATAEPVAETSEDQALRTILTRSYQPVAPRKEFETRLLENLKERQRHTAVLRSSSRRRTLFFSGASGIAAAAMVAFALWINPAELQTNDKPVQINAFASLPAADSASPRRDLRLTVPDGMSSSTFGGGVIPASVTTGADTRSFEAVPASFAAYRVADAFTGPALPERASALQNMEYNAGDGWTALAGAEQIPLLAGVAFRSRGGMGHVRFSDGSLVTVSPNAIMKATDDGLSIEQGVALVSVPDESRAGFRLHFPERDIAIEPGTDLAVMVESPDGYADGGAPAPVVMVVDRQDSPGGLALARGAGGIGPLLAKQVYRLDRYVTPDLPSRALCDTECQDLDNFFKMETVRQVDHPMASFAGGFAGDRDMGYTATIVTPAGYSKRGDKWVSDKYDGQPTIRLKYLSDEYFGFANERRDLARDLSLGAEVVINGGDGKFYEITR